MFEYDCESKLNLTKPKQRAEGEVIVVVVQFSEMFSFPSSHTHTCPNDVSADDLNDPSPF